MLTLDALACRRGGRALFVQLGLTIGEGAAVLLCGPNGSGKTSLLRMLAGFLKPAEGWIRWQDEPVERDYGGYARDLCYVGHRHALCDAMTVAEHLQCWAALSDTRELVAPAAAYFKLKPALETPCGLLSAGWRRRVALARLMIKPSALWLLDEPLAHLDAETRDGVVRLIASRCDQGGIAVVACQDDTRLPFGAELSLRDFAPAGQ